MYIQNDTHFECNSKVSGVIPQDLFCRRENFRNIISFYFILLYLLTALNSLGAFFFLMDLFIHKNPLNINAARNDCPLTVLSVISISHLFVWSVGRHLFISFPVSQFNNWTCSFPKKLLKSPSFSFGRSSLVPKI